MREQYLDIQDSGKKIILINKVNIDNLLFDNYSNRMENPNGWTKGKTMQKIASIPVDLLNNCPEGYYFMQSKSGTPEAKIALKKFLEKYPDYKASGVRI